MARYLVTGGAGFLGRHLVSRLQGQGHAVLTITRHPVGVDQIKGDVLEPGLGLERDPGPVDGLWHLVAIVDLGQDKGGIVFRTNVEGTTQAIAFCLHRQIPLYYVSTAYTIGRNAYELSKVECETLIHNSTIPAVIYKPSILIADVRTADPGGTRGFYQFVGVAARVHRRAEAMRRRIEGGLRLPVIEPVLRIRGEPEASINLLPVDVVADFMAAHRVLGQTYYVTNPNPPTLAQLAEWVGEAILLQIRFLPDFKATPIEAILGRLTRSFNPYLWGDNIPSDLPSGEPLVTRELIQRSATRAVLRL